MLNSIRNTGRLEIGVDEAGKGCLLGRVYAAAVIWPEGLIPDPPNLVRDSKKYSRPAIREDAYQYVIDHALGYGISWAEPSEIDTMGIDRANINAMHRAIQQARENFECGEALETVDGAAGQLTYDLLVDGNRFAPMPYDFPVRQTTTVISGDDTYYSIAAASVLAKVSRDHYVLDLCQKFPVLKYLYNLDHCKGYGSKYHMDGLAKYGPILELHRMSYRPCREALAAQGPFDLAWFQPLDLPYR